MSLIIRNLLQASQQIVGIDNYEPTCSLGQFIKDLLVVGDVRNVGNDLPGLRELSSSIRLAGAYNTRPTGGPASSAPTGSATTRPAAMTTPAASSTAATRSATVSAPTPSTSTPAVLSGIKGGEFQRIERSPGSGVGKSCGRHVSGYRMQRRMLARALRRC